MTLQKSLTSKLYLFTFPTPPIASFFVCKIIQILEGLGKPKFVHWVNLYQQAREQNTYLMMIVRKSISPFLSLAEISPEHEAFSFFAS